MNNLKHLREEKGLSQTDLAHKIYVSRSLIALIETGKARATPYLLNRLCEYFECDVTDLYKETIAA